MRKVLAATVREYKTTALTKAFLFGAVIFPLVIWAAFIGIAASGLLASKKEPLSGTVGIIDTTEGAVVAANLDKRFDPEKLAAQRAAQLEEVRRLVRENEFIRSAIGAEEGGAGGADGDGEEAGQVDRAIERGVAMAQSLGFGDVPEVEIERVDAGIDRGAVRKRVGKDDLLALVIVGPQSVVPPPLGDGEEGVPEDAGEDDGAEEAPGTFTFLHAEDLDPDYVKQIRGAVIGSIQEERYRRAQINPLVVKAIEQSPPRGRTRSIDESGQEQRSSEAIAEFLPLIFLMLLFTATITGGQYLLMGTLEEKGSRVMEVLLSAVSPMQLLIGKLMGQGLVGLTILGIYSALGVALADRFNYLALIPVEQIPWLVVYFVMAYAFLGSMMVAVGAAVTEIREAQALYAPITISMLLPFILMIPIMENPSSIFARVFSFIPPTTPFVMVMRLSQPAHPIPAWEIALSIVVGFAGVAVVMWGAAKIFRVGVLMYGKPPNLLTLLKWLRYA